MTSTTIINGQTVTTRLDMAANDDLTVDAGGSLSVSANQQSVRFTSTATGALITNNGTIENTAGGRAIRFENTISSPLTATISNTGTIQSGNDAIQIDGGVTSGTLTISNTGGTIQSTGIGRALDLAGGTGAFLAVVANAANIFADASDAVRFGGVGNLTNTGTIDGGHAVAYSGGDGVQYEDNSSGTVTNNAGTISGDRHGINGGVGSTVTVVNALGATITGRNGSGVGLDGNGTVTNFGTITGNFSNSPGSDTSGPIPGTPDGINDGDGDGIDIDGQATIVNHGTIQGTGAGGHGSDGFANTSEAIAAGGGSITNHAGANITGANLGILIDDSHTGPAPFLTTIVNDGAITGGTSFAIRIISNLADTITNNGNITGTGGTAIKFGNGNNTLFLGASSNIAGLTDGEGGTDTLNYSNFGAGGTTVNLLAGTATGTGGVANFQNVVGSAGADTITGDSGANTLSGNGGVDTLDAGAGTNMVTLGAGNDVFVASRSTTAATDTTITDFGSRYFTASLDGMQQNPDVITAATGASTLALNRTSTVFTVSTTTTGLDFGGVGANGVTDFHIHAGAAEVNGGVVWDIRNDTSTVQDQNAESFTSIWTSGEGLTAQLTNLFSGNLYENIHTVGHGGGEIRGQVLAVAGDTGADRIDLRGFNIGSLATFQAVTADVGGSATMMTSLNSFASVLRISGVTEASLTAADLIFAGTVNQSIVGTAGNDYLFGAGGNDVINGLAGNDWLFGENDNDTLDAGAGTNMVTLGAGNDVFTASRSTTVATDTTITDFGSRYFTATLLAANQVNPSVVSAATGDGEFVLNRAHTLLTASTTTTGLDFGGGGANGVTGFHLHNAPAGQNGGIVWDIAGDGQTVVDTGAESFTSAWSSGAEGLTAQLANLFSGNLYENIHTVGHGGGEIRGQVLAVAGDTGADRVDLRGFNIGSLATFQAVTADVGGSATMMTFLNSFASVLRISGVTEASLTAADLIFAGTVNQSILGTAGNDYLFGAGGNDVISGLAGNDRLFGENDNDTLVGGLGTDALFGGLGNDTYVLENASDGVVDTGGTADRITSTATRSLLSYAAIEQLTLVGASNINGTGNNLANILTGNAANNLLDGGLGNDRLVGLGGNDVLIGWAGKDTSTGGLGNDIFRFRATSHSPVGAGADVITDFDKAGNDRIDLSLVFGPALAYRHNGAFTAAGQVRINDIAGPDVIVEVNTGGSLAADMQIRLTATTLASMTASDFVL